MKLITATIRTTHAEAIKDELAKVGILGMTTMDVQGYGAQGGHSATYRGTTYKVSFSKKLQIQIIVKGDQEDLAIKTICEVAKTGNLGDGKIWVSDIARVVRVRTGEEGEAAI